MNDSIPASYSRPSVIFVDRGLSYFGGITNVFLNLVRNLPPGQLRLAIATLEPPFPEMARTFGALGVKVCHLGNFAYLVPAWNLRCLQKGWGADLVVATSLRSYLVSRLALLGRPCRTVYWIHGIDQIVKSRLKYRFFQWLSRHETLLFISQAAMNTNVPAGHEGKAIVIYNGVEDHLQHPEWQPYSIQRRAELGLNHDDVVMGYIASIDGYKDQRTLLHGVALLANDYPKLHLLLIGRGAELDEMKALSASLNLQERVHFLGVRPDARSLLGLMDIYVHPAFAEGFGLSVVEAMLAQRAVLVADAGALPEIVLDGKNGVLFRAKDPEDLARQARRLLDDPEFARQLGLQARTDSLKRFDPQDFALQVLDFLRAEILESKSPGRELSSHAGDERAGI